MRVSHYHYYCFIYHRSEKATVISAGGENERQIGPRTKPGSSPSEAREAGVIPELTGRFPTPNPSPRAWAPMPGAWADLRPPARRVGAGFPSADACQKLTGRIQPLGSARYSHQTFLAAAMFQSHPEN